MEDTSAPSPISILKKSGKLTFSHGRPQTPSPPLRTHSPAPHGVSGCGDAEPRSQCGSPARGKDVAEFREGCEQCLEHPRNHSPSSLYLSATGSPCYHPPPHPRSRPYSCRPRTQDPAPSSFNLRSSSPQPSPDSTPNPRSPGTSLPPSDLTFPSTQGAQLTNTFPACLFCQCVPLERHFLETEAELSSFCRQSDSGWSGSAGAPIWAAPPPATHTVQPHKPTQP